MCAKCNCGCGSACNEEESLKVTEITVDFLYLNLDTCDRCIATELALNEAMAEAKPALEAAGAKVVLRKKMISSRAEAIALRFESSPTIRISGRDIDSSPRESGCKECSDICGTDVECRAWSYRGRSYDCPPKPMIIDAILREVYSPTKEMTPQSEFTLPQNLEKFFAGVESQLKRF